MTVDGRIMPRRRISVPAARAGGVITTDMPAEPPLSSVPGRARIGRARITGALLELHPTSLVVHHRGVEPRPLVILRSGTGRIRVGPGLLGMSLRLFDRSGRRLGFMFWAMDARALYRGLADAGWQTMLV